MLGKPPHQFLVTPPSGLRVGKGVVDEFGVDSSPKILERNFARNLQKIGKAVERMRLAGQRRGQRFQIEEKAARMAIGLASFASTVVCWIVARVGEIDPSDPPGQMLDAQIWPNLIFR